jgi:hypothetical protein
MGTRETITATIKGNYNLCEKTYGLPTIWAKNGSLVISTLVTWRAVVLLTARPLFPVWLRLPFFSDYRRNWQSTNTSLAGIGLLLPGILRNKCRCW